jgi:ribosomal protein RSM22 (predicted rRNA methylase)
MKRGRHIVVDLCTKLGTFERRVAAKCHGPEYKEIKKLRWGDYWRFGKRIPNKYRKERKTGKRLW